MGNCPVLTVATHGGHSLRSELVRLSRLSEAQRLQEEDPFTDAWTKISTSRIVVHPSRFEVDLNRPRTSAVYASPEEAWGLDLWKEPLTTAMQRRSLVIYDRFYTLLKAVLDDLCHQFGGFVLLDLHSYNHRRTGIDGEPADPEGHPDINVGTGTVPMPKYRTLVDHFMAALSGFPIGDRRLDVRENIKFRGRHLAAWVHEHYGHYGCVLAIEVKKFFMDEWSGELDIVAHSGVREALRRTIPTLEKDILYANESTLPDHIQPPARSG